jgi:hypothetical protein
VPVITNEKATLKYLSDVYQPRRLILRSYITARDVPQLAARLGPMDVVFLDRVDSDMFREDQSENARFLADVEARCVVSPRYQAAQGAAATLRILRIQRCT